MQRNLLSLALGLQCLVGAFAQNEVRYPNELPEFQFATTARWRSLVPLVSTSSDVRAALGVPESAVDIAHYFDPYPGDDAAEQPVLTYALNEDWKILIYFVRSDLSKRNKFPKSVYDHLYCIDIVPKKRVIFRKSIPSTFKTRKVFAADGAWNEYHDGSGLRYKVYTSKTPYGGDQPGDLNRISYGPSDAEVTRHAEHK